MGGPRCCGVDMLRLERRTETQKFGLFTNVIILDIILDNKFPISINKDWTNCFCEFLTKTKSTQDTLFV